VDSRYGADRRALKQLGARRQGSLAPQLPRATQSSESLSEKFSKFSDFEFITKYNSFCRFAPCSLLQILLLGHLPGVCARPNQCKRPRKYPYNTPTLDRRVGRYDLDLKKHVFWGTKTHDRDQCNDLETKALGYPLSVFNKNSALKK